MADVVPSEELRSFLLRLYAVWAAQDFEALREMFSTGPHLLVIALMRRSGGPGQIASNSVDAPGQIAAHKRAVQLTLYFPSGLGRLHFVRNFT